MSKRSNKTRTYLALEEIYDKLEAIIYGDEVSLMNLRELLDEMKKSVQATEGESDDS
jgi:hypothetical protein